MTYRKLYLLTVLLPTVVIGGFEYLRHDFLLPYIPMETGNLYITVIAFLMSFLFASWVFRTIKKMNDNLLEERARLAVYEERERLARELHDGIAQSLFYLNVKLRLGELDEARSAVSEIDNHLRQAIFNLRSLPEEGSNRFPLRLEGWLNQWSVLAGIDVEHDIEIPDDYFHPSEEVQLFGIIQEALTNIRKHADARHATLSLQAEPGQAWQLTITDDGKGFCPEEIHENKYGITMMQERANRLHASFSIASQPTGGTKLTLRSYRGGKRK